MQHFNLSSLILFLIQSQSKKQQIYQMADPKKEDFIDLKTIPKIQFELIDEQLIRTIKELSFQIKSHDKILNDFKNQFRSRVTQSQLLQSFQLLQSNIEIPSNISSNSKKRPNKVDSQNPQMKSRNACLLFSNKLCQITDIVSLVFNKMASLQKQVNSSQFKLTELVKQKTGSIQDRFQYFIKENRQKIDTINSKINSNADVCTHQIKQMQANTIWKINQCSKRLEQKPSIQMVKTCVQQLQERLSKNMGTSHTIMPQPSSNSDFLQHKILKLEKQINYKLIQTESKLSNLSQQIANQYLDTKVFGQYRIQIQKKIENLIISSGQVYRRIKFLQAEKEEQIKKVSNCVILVDNLNTQVTKFKDQLEKLALGEEFISLLQKIDPHEICKLSGRVQNIESELLQSSKRVSNLSGLLDLIRSKTQFWGLANSKPTQVKDSSLNPETIKNQLKAILQQSDIYSKIRAVQNQISESSGLKDVVNGIMKSLSKYNKDNDLTNIRYQIKGIQEYLKRQLLIQNDRINSLQVNINDQVKLNKRPKSGMSKTDDGRLLTSVSTKKLISLNCLSCYQTQGMQRKMVSKRSVYDNFLKK